MKYHPLCGWIFILSLMLVATCIPALGVFADTGLNPVDDNGFLYYEFTDGVRSGDNDAPIAYGDWYGGRPGATNNSFVLLAGGNVTLNINVPYAGKYNVYVSGSSYNADNNAYASVFVNGTECFYYADHNDFCKWQNSYVSWCRWVEGVATFDEPALGFELKAGLNEIKLSYNDNGGWILIDRLALRAATDMVVPEDSAAGLVIKAMNDALPETVTEENYAEVLAVKDSFDALSSFDKSVVQTTKTYSDWNKKAEEAKQFTLIKHQVFNDDGYSYQVESGILEGGVYVNTGVAGYTGDGFVLFAGGNVTMKIKVPYTGYYKIGVAASSYNNENDANAKVFINGGDEYYALAKCADYGKWNVSVISYYDYDKNSYEPCGGFYLTAGENTVELKYNDYSGWVNIDRLVLIPDSLVYGDGDPAGEVAALIEALPDTDSVTADDKAAVQEAKSAYDSLDADGRVAVTNYDKLKALFDAMTELNVIEATDTVDGYVYEIEEAMHTDRSFTAEDANASGGKYINIAYGTLYMNINVAKAGNYKLKIFGSTNDAGSNKCDYVSVNGGENKLVAFSSASYGSWEEAQPGTENWADGKLCPIPPTDGFALNEGNNLIVIRANWGNTNYDKLVLVPILDGDVNDDGKLNATDIQVLRSCILGTDSENEAVKPDVNGDKTVDIKDMVRLKKLLAEQEN